MFKISEPIIKYTKDIKYFDIQNKENIENYNIISDTISLNSNTKINSCKFENVVFCFHNYHSQRAARKTHEYYKEYFP